MAALGGIPWVGSLISAAAGFSAEKDQERTNDLLKIWIEEHHEKILLLIDSLEEIFNRLDNFGDEINERIESDEYLTLVRKTFRAWDQADTDEKRQMFKRLIMNAGATKLCTDDLVRLFVKWVEDYHESHFIIIGKIYNAPGITRGNIWNEIVGETPREDSSEADLFKFLFRDLSTGGVIRQIKNKTADGQFLKSKSYVSKQFRTTVMESAFEDTKGYELTNLGQEFVHYVMKEVATQIEGDEK